MLDRVGAMNPVAKVSSMTRQKRYSVGVTMCMRYYTASLLLMLLLLPGGRWAGGQSGLKPMLPAPTGTYSIGRQAFHLIDTSRADPFSADPAKHRELMVYIWYPARRSTRQTQGEYLPGANQLDSNPTSQEAARNEFGPYWPLIASGQITSHAVSNAAAATQAGGFPVVLFSHGVTSTTFSYTAQIEDLVSHGYVVVAIEHTDAAGIVLFPDGHVRLLRDPPAPHSSAPAAKDPLQAMIASAEEGTETGAEDVRFVLDTLAQQKIPLVKIMDLKKVAAVGHSYGGTLTARACQLDSRIKACISEDGTVNPVGAFFDYPDHALLKQPFLLIEVDQSYTDAELARMAESRARWDEYLAHKHLQVESCGVGSYDVVLKRPGMAHASFSDGLLLSAVPGSAEASTALSNLVLTETIDRNFLDKYLKGEPAPLLDQPAKTPSGVVVEPVGR
jgi:predicted dienelactone hydrolase